MTPQFKATGAILLGGQSTRMGRPKHAIAMADGRMMIEHVLDAIQQVCGDTVLVGPPLGGGFNRCQTIADIGPGLGPLGGIGALLASGLDDQYLVCPCDMPRISADLLRRLLKPSSAPATILRLQNRTEVEPLPARISASALEAVRKTLDSGERALWRFMQMIEAEVVAIPSDFEPCFHNVNTPDDLTVNT